MKRLTALLAALAVFTLSTAAGASPLARNVVIKVDDAVAVVGTKVACYALRANGKTGVTCFKLDSKGLASGTFGVGIAQDGTVTAYKVNAQRKPKQIFRRAPQSAAAQVLDLAAAKTYRLSSGTTFRVMKTSVFCQILTIRSGVAPLYRGIKVGCFRADGVGPLPKSNGVVISNKFIAAFSFKADRKAGASFFERVQP